MGRAAIESTSLDNEIATVVVGALKAEASGTGIDGEAG